MTTDELAIGRRSGAGVAGGWVLVSALLCLLCDLGEGMGQAAQPLTPAAEPSGGSATHLNSLAYTVVRTPPAERIAVPPLERDRNVLLGTVRPFPDREVPPVFWYDAAGMSYGLVYQKQRAPLVFLIAGTGGSFNTDTNRLLAQVLYDAGLHVLGLAVADPPELHRQRARRPASPAAWRTTRATSTAPCGWPTPR